jgi:glycosyltransferase involved in cell wall biosynthesis
MPQFPVFLSTVVVVRNRAAMLRTLLGELGDALAPLASDYELIVIDNASTDESVAVLKALTGEDGLPNLQVYSLTKEVDADTACWVGLENALGDFVAVLDPLTEDIGFLPAMLDEAVGGNDVVLAANRERPRQGPLYNACFAVFNLLYRWFNDVHLGRDAPHFRLLSRRVVNFILQHPAPALAYRHLPVTGGFPRVNLQYAAAPRSVARKRLIESIDRGLRLLVSSTRGPLRMVAMLSLFGAVSNLVYSAYVIAVFIWKEDVAPGWVTLSLQQSGMFFLISLVLLVLGEYIIHMARLSNEGPPYHVAQEFTSSRMTRHMKLNLEVPAEPEPSAPGRRVA